MRDFKIAEIDLSLLEIRVAAYWNRILTPEEIEILRENPYAMLWPPGTPWKDKFWYKVEKLIDWLRPQEKI